MQKVLTRLQKNKQARKLLNTKARYVWAKMQFPLRKSALHKLGWYQSAWRNAAIDAQGKPIPWITYSAIHFLQPRISKSMRVFEFGSGNSTLWWSKHSKEVVSAEYDKNWFMRMAAIKPSNCTFVMQELDNQGSFSATILKQKGLFDIVFVDARERVECVKKSVQKLTKSGVVILDNSDRDRYKSARQFMKKNGFKEIDFIGPVPIDNALSMTTVFYRPNNVLGI